MNTRTEGEKMTEQEIVQYLKKNKNVGVAFAFMSKEVQEWLRENISNPSLLYLAPKGVWKFFSETNFDDYDNVVFALSKYYEGKQEPKGEWVEFDIIDKGLFFLEYTDRGGSNVSHRFYWHQWSQFLEYCDIDELNYTAFGGWLYENDERWYLAPTIQLECGTMWNSYIINVVGEVKPAIPVKIRFWRENA